MKIIVDTRERTPWTFEGKKGVVLERAKLETGDYSIAGLEARVTIERKSLSDWINTVLRDSARFYRELERMRAFDFRCVIIETSVAELFSKRTRESVSPESMMGFVAEVSVSQCVPVYLGGSRAESQELAVALLRMADKKFKRDLEDAPAQG